MDKNIEATADSVEKPDIKCEEIDSETRTRRHTDKGQTYLLEVKTKQLKGAIRQLIIKTDEIKDLISGNADAVTFRHCYSQWMVCYEDYLNYRSLYKTLLPDPGEDQFCETDTTFLSLKAQAESYCLRVSSPGNMSDAGIQPSDSASASGDSRRKARSKADSRASSATSISSARLKEAQRKAEITMKMEALQRRRELELAKLDIKVKEEQLELDTQMAICNAKSQILDDLDSFSQKKEKSLLNVGKSKQGSETFKDHTNALRADAPLFVPSHVEFRSNVHVPKVKTECNETDADNDNVEIPVSCDAVDSLVPNPNVKNESVGVASAEEIALNTCCNVSHGAEHTQSLSDPTAYYTDHHKNIAPHAIQNLPTRPHTNVPSDIECVVRQLRKPAPEIHKFSGDPLEYKRFMRQFYAKVVSNCDNYEERLNYLEQYTDGEARKIVTGYGYLDAEVGYKAALQEFERRYGNDEAIANAFVKRALEWPTVRPDDSKGLDQFSIFLTECDNAIRSIQSVKVLEYPENLKRLVGKLPYFLHDKWRTIVQQTRQKAGLIHFSHLVNFVRSEACKATDPTYGKDALRTDPVGAGNKAQNRHQKSPVVRNKSSFATKVQDCDAAKPIQSSSYTVHEPVADTKTASKRSAFVSPCLFCEDTRHCLEQCDKLFKLPYQDKMDVIKGKQLCFGCLRYGHRRKDCRNKATCRHCSYRHPTVCHVDGKPPKLESDTPSNVVKGSKVNPTSACASVDTIDEECAMSIVPVTVMMKNGLTVLQTYAFLDPGSSASFCSENLLNRLGGSGKHMKITIDTMGSPHTMKTQQVHGLVVGDVHMENFITLPRVYTKETMPVSPLHIPKNEELRKWPHLDDVNLPIIDAGIDLLIGNDVPDAYTPLECKTGPRGTPHATRSLLGWIPWNLIRSTADSNGETHITVNRVSVTAIQDMEDMQRLDRHLQQAIMLDFPEHIINDKREYSQQDKRFVEIVKRSIQVEDGHYSINLPFKQDNVQMPDNKSQAQQRLRGLQSKMSRSQTFSEDYRTFMQNVVDKGYAKRVPPDELKRTDGKTWYIPHHGVYHPNKPGKIRVVFDCSASYLGTSLNNILLQGPNLANNLLSVLLRFREERVALMADVEAMYYQVKVPREDCDLLRYLWWPDGDIGKEPETYRMLVHLFGAVSSPSCAIAALRKAAEDNEDKFGPEIAEAVRHSFYVDDLLKSTETEDKAIRLIEGISGMCRLGGFRLTKWTTNSRTVLETIPEEERAKSVRDLDIGCEQLPTERALGVHWSPEKDTLGFNIKVQDKPASRRGILSVVSSIYDPLGLASPFVLTAKIILQDLCRKGVRWDDNVEGNDLKDWHKWRDGLTQLQKIEISRCYKPNNFGKIDTIDMHVFSDASESGYGVVIYFRFTNELGQHNCSLVMGKSRVAPLKRISIPRMELTAATLAVRLAKMTVEQVNYLVNKTFFWTDSMSVLRYIANESTRFHTFVSNRLTVIHSGSKPDQWNYVPSEMNPADPASRGLPIDKFLSRDSWFYGPSFLWMDEIHWPKPESEENRRDVQPNDPEVKSFSASVSASSGSNSTIEHLLSRHSGWLRMRSALGWVLYAVECFKTSKKARAKLSKANIQNMLKRTYLPIEKLHEAESLLIQHEQLHFSKETKAIRDNKCVPKSSPLRKLDPILVEGVLRVGGRINQAETPYQARHPAILPKASKLSDMIIEFAHKCVGHLGKNVTLANLRQRYWILGAGSSIKKLTNRCVTCRKYRAKRVEQKMSELPPDRVSRNPAPFTAVGMDYFGSFDVKRGRSVQKRYGVVFTCLASRAIHLEVAHSLTTDSCINAIRRLVARRGPVSLIRSDNGTNLVGSERELREEINHWNQQKLHATLHQKNIKWIFNTPAASHHGGVWERMIRTIRKVLYSILKEQTIKMDDEGLSTLFCEVESIVNSRPITDVPSDPHDLECLTPNHLLFLRTGEDLPPGHFQKVDCYAKQRWRQVQFLADLFWRRWTREYLPLLQTRQKWQQIKRNLQVDDIVLVIDNTPRNSWCLARVVEVMADRSGLVRSAKVKTKTTHLVRPVDKFCLILGNNE